MSKRKKRGWIWLVVIVVLVVAAIFGWQQLNRKMADAAKMAAEAMQQSYTVARGDIETVIVANGTLAPDETVTVRVPDGITVEQVLVTAGEEVAKGQTVALLSEESVRAQMIALQKKLKSEDGSLRSSGEFDSLTSPATGRIKYMPVAEGDDVLSAMGEYGALAILSTDGWMRLSIQTDEALTLGERMAVKWDGGGVEGTISRKTEDGYLVLVPDARAPYQATARLMDGDKEIGSGVLTINMPVSVLGYSGTIKTIRYHVDESVPNGREIFAIKNSAPSIAFEQHYAVRSKYAEQMEKLIAYSADPRILAEYDGVVGEVSIKDGEPTGKSTDPEKESTAYTIATGGAVKMNIDVDELDILKVVDGATAEISLEALPQETLSGKVTGISKTGKKNNSISVFPVELTLDPDARLLSGMNGSATIMIDRAENVLLIPVEAISEDELGTFVNVVREDGTTARIPITTGRSNGEVAEVTSGLSEGDVITYTLVSDLIDFGMMGTAAVSVSSEDGGDGDVVVVG